MQTLILTLHIIVCVLLVILILLQAGKEGMGVIFGGGNSSVFGSGGAGGILEMNVYKPLMIFNIMKALRIMTDAMHNFRVFMVEGMEPDRKRIAGFVNRSLMLVTALSPVIGYDKASQIAHYAMEHDLTLREAAMDLGFVDEAEFDRIVVPSRMTTPSVAKD